jgi:hypothetical protein
MVSERDEARGSIVAEEPIERNAGEAIKDARQLEHELEQSKESNRHTEVKLDKRTEFAPLAIASAVVLLGFIVFFCAMVAASWYGNHAEFWAKQGERGIGVATAALAYIFGKSK